MPKARKLPSGSWQVQVYSHLEYVDGKPKRIRKIFTAPTKAEAEYQAALFKRQHTRKTDYSLTLGDAMLGYIDSKDGILSPSTITGYKSMQRIHLKELQEKPLHKITNLDIQIALNKAKKEHDLSAKSVKNLSGFVSAAIGLYREDFRYKVTLPEKERYDYHLPTQDDITALLAYTEGKELHTAILLAACLGLRRGEICALKWGDFDWKRKEVKINKSMVRTEDKEWKVKNPKSYAGNRTLVLSDGLITELQKVKKKSGPVIEGTPTHISHRFRWAVKALGLEHFRFHDLRHFNASLMMAEGVPDKYAIERMGHSTTAILKSVYQHTEDKKRNEVNTALNTRIDSFLDCQNGKLYS